MSGYSDGRKLEYAAMLDLTENGYWTIRAAGSKGAADIVAIKAGQLIFIQCKRSGVMAPAERAVLLDLATMFKGIPLCARWVKAGRAARTVEFRQLTGPGPKDWRPWSADYALEVTP